MGDKDPWDILWFGAFETTAFLTAVLVGAFSFIPDPTGRQDSKDSSEIHVYNQWRVAVALISADIVLKLIVLVVQVANDVEAYTAVWTLLLMAAPWAPFLQKVVAVFRQWSSVHDMMNTRVVRNEVSAVLREYLQIGQSLRTPVLVYEVMGEPFTLPTTTLQEVAQHTIRSTFESPAYIQQVERLLGDVKEKGVPWVVTRRAAQREPDLPPPASHQRRLRLRRVDAWTRMWTNERLQSVADPFAPGCLARQDAAAAPTAAAGRERRDSKLLLMRRAYVLDVIDECHWGQTLSQSRSKESLPEKLCRRCQVAVRGAIEAFLESSRRTHAGVHARAWLDDVTMDWHGHMDGVVDGMWEAAFIDHAALRVDDGELDEARPARPGAEPTPSATVTTRKFLLFLFLVARSLLGVCLALKAVGAHIKSRLNSEEWWTDYWKAVLQELRSDRGANDSYDDWMDNLRTKVTRRLIVKEMKLLVQLLASHPIRLQIGTDANGKERATGAFCGADGCFLNTQTTVVVKTRQRP